MLRTPYYKDQAVTLYHADARELLPGLAPLDVVVTDPVWPNALPELAGAADPFALLASVGEQLARLAPRLVLQLGCLSDPRILAAVPPALPFVRACWLRYLVPNPRGTLLNGADVAYVFGHARLPGTGTRVLPGEVLARENTPRRRGHPCPRRPEHVRFLVEHFSRPGDTILDPFAGLGTTGEAAKLCGRRAVLIEIEEKYCEGAARLLARTPICAARQFGQHERMKRENKRAQLVMKTTALAVVEKG